MLEQGADANLYFQYSYKNSLRSDRSPLYVAVRDNYIEGIQLLLTYGADPLKKPSPHDLSPIELAIDQESWDILSLLLSAMNH